MVILLACNLSLHNYKELTRPTLLMAAGSCEPVELTSITPLVAERVREEAKFSLNKTRRKTLRHRREKLSHLEKNSGRARMFGVTCNFGTDDFFFLTILSAAVRATW